ncbi:MAG: DUF2520 domain-containing protein [Salinivirgaceae bacterium]|nr:DUF2520 domain-containing protein [Salinivirgaceae bacterium]
MKIFVIGSGNVATHLSGALLKAGHTIAGVCGRSFEHADELAKKLNARPFDSLAHIPTDADVYLISVSDDSIADVAAQMPDVKGIVAHTAGSVIMDVLKRFENHGVIYPMQSFTKNRQLNVGLVPFFVEGCTNDVADKLIMLAKTISTDVRLMTSKERKYLHLSAVFASNFVNGMFAEAEAVLKHCRLPFSVLQPLIEETVSKALEMGPVAAQTGPARRGDAGVMQTQQKMLDDENQRNLYSFASKRITERYRKP